MNDRPDLVFVSPRFLFPADSGGAIRTSQILKGIRGGRFRITLLSPATDGDADRYRNEIVAVADEAVFWTRPRRLESAQYTRLRHLISTLPLSVADDRSRAASRVVAETMSRKKGVAVFDFVHSAVLAPDPLEPPSIVFTHNCEAEIYERLAASASSLLLRRIWSSQFRKMRAFEQRALRRFSKVVAVSERDRARLEHDYRLRDISVIPTGVDLDFFSFSEPGSAHRVVFTGSMDSPANIDAMRWFLDSIWPAVSRNVPGATMNVIGKSPPERLKRKAAAARYDWQFTGWIEDIRPHAAGASAAVIPLRVGGGTRIKAYEAMAMGIPLVSTSIGVEGLGLTPDVHFIRADTEMEFGDAVITLLTQPALGRRLAMSARKFLEHRFSANVAAKCFEEICWEAYTRSAQSDGSAQESGFRAAFRRGTN